uniref:Beta-glucosidase n=1 Tax=Clastoptera arizonana TaxID=38151 RepID=A0A1B6DTT1_9HEMI
MFQIRYVVFALSLLGWSICLDEDFKFPDGFKIGAASSAYQIEGAFNEDGKGESIWDRFVRQNPSPIKNNSTGDVAADSYHKYKEDVQLLKSVGFDHYRFSISWTRIQPKGEINEINKKGIDYYNALIDELLANKIEPLVTMTHFDLPQALQDLGGWLNPEIVNYFEDYAYILFTYFGDRVKYWITINEGLIMLLGYNLKVIAPGLHINGSGEYLAAHNIIRAHAKAYRLYQREFKEKQNGQVGFLVVGKYMMPFDDSEESKRATERAFQFTIGWFAHPIFSEEGNYPQIMREVIERNSIAEKRRRSRLPSFTPEEINEIKGSADFFGLNHYSTYLVKAKHNFTGGKAMPPITDRDFMVELSCDPSWNSSGGNKNFCIFPTGLRGILNFIKNNYNNPPVFITENGYGDSGRKDDQDRINYHQDYMTELLKSIHIDKCNVFGYTVWSLLDSFEWNSGYSLKFGLIHVDYEDRDRKRSLKQSARYFQDVLKERILPKSAHIKCKTFRKAFITYTKIPLRKTMLKIQLYLI